MALYCFCDNRLMFHHFKKEVRPLWPSWLTGRKRKIKLSVIYAACYITALVLVSYAFSDLYRFFTLFISWWYLFMFFLHCLSSGIEKISLDLEGLMICTFVRKGNIEETLFRNVSLCLLLFIKYCQDCCTLCWRLDPCDVETSEKPWGDPERLSAVS